MSEDDDSTASNWVERAEHEQRVVSAEAEDGLITCHHQERLEPARFNHIQLTTTMTFSSATDVNVFVFVNVSLRYRTNALSFHSET